MNRWSSVLMLGICGLLSVGAAGQTDLTLPTGGWESLGVGGMSLGGLAVWLSMRGMTEAQTRRLEEAKEFAATLAAANASHQEQLLQAHAAQMALQSQTLADYRDLVARMMQQCPLAANALHETVKGLQSHE